MCQCPLAQANSQFLCLLFIPRSRVQILKACRIPRAGSVDMRSNQRSADISHICSCRVNSWSCISREISLVNQHTQFLEHFFFRGSNSCNLCNSFIFITNLLQCTTRSCGYITQLWVRSLIRNLVQRRDQHWQEWPCINRVENQFGHVLDNNTRSSLCFCRTLLQSAIHDWYQDCHACILHGLNKCCCRQFCHQISNLSRMSNTRYYRWNIWIQISIPSSITTRKQSLLSSLCDFHSAVHNCL
mmetsp:Transcript_11226/g.22416  ORF Transcript_11226/g.22416 Transcript_11226/m.22416 type:complete len:243 (-) Transcript_11226:85-813(-)